MNTAVNSKGSLTLLTHYQTPAQLSLSFKQSRLSADRGDEHAAESKLK